MYLLYHVVPMEGKTLNAVLVEQMTATWPAWLGKSFIIAALASSAALLFIAAANRISGGPRVLANMAGDRWMPTRFANLSDRLVTQNGGAADGRGGAGCRSRHTCFDEHTHRAFTASTCYHLQPLATRHGAPLWLDRAKEVKWKRKFFINGVGFLLTTGILISLCHREFFEGGWATLLVTGIFDRRGLWHQTSLRKDAKTSATPQRPSSPHLKWTPRMRRLFPATQCDPKERTAVFLVNGFNGHRPAHAARRHADVSEGL